MELVTISSDELNTLRKFDIIFDPNSEKLFEYRNREGKALLIREIGQTKISKILKNTIKNVLKVSDLQQYQVIEIQENNVTLFNSISGETFYLGFGDQENRKDEIKLSFIKGDVITAHVFEYENISIVIKFETNSQEKEQSKGKIQDKQISDEDLERIKEIEQKKAKKRPFTGDSSSEIKIKTTKKGTKKIPKKSAKKTTKKTIKKVAKKITKKTTKKIIKK